MKIITSFYSWCSIRIKSNSCVGKHSILNQIHKATLLFFFYQKKNLVQEVTRITCDTVFYRKKSIIQILWELISASFDKYLSVARIHKIIMQGKFFNVKELVIKRKHSTSLFANGSGLGQFWTFNNIIVFFIYRQIKYFQDIFNRITKMRAVYFWN